MFNLCRLLHEQQNNFSLEFKVCGQIHTYNSYTWYMYLVIEIIHMHLVFNFHNIIYSKTGFKQNCYMQKKNLL